MPESEVKVTELPSRKLYQDPSLDGRGHSVQRDGIDSKFCCELDPCSECLQQNLVSIKCTLTGFDLIITDYTIKSTSCLLYYPE